MKAAAACLFLALCSAADFDTALRGGLLALNRNDLPAAQAQLEAASKLEPRRAEVWVALAQTYLKRNNRAAADDAARKAETLNPTNPPVLHSLAVYFAETSHYDKAGALEMRFAAGNRDVEAYRRAARWFQEAKRPGDTIAALEAVLKLRPYEELSYFDLGQQLLQLQRFQPALEILDQGRQRFDKSAQIELARGVALYGLRRFPEAIDAFLQTIQLAPDVRQPYIFLGRMLDVAEEKLPAITHVFETYAQAEPDNFLGALLYAKALAAGAGGTVQIEALLRRSIELKPDYWESHFQLGLTLERKRAFPESAQELERAAALNPDDPVLHYRLARVYDRLGKTAEAAREREIHARLFTAVK